MVKAENLVKEFIKTEKEGRKTVKTKFRAVNGISLTALEGKTIGILGPNGAGKTTLLRMIATMMEPTEGRVIHTDENGQPIDDIVKIKSNMGYMSNNTKLYEKFTVREMLTLMGEIYGFTDDYTQERIDVIVKRLNLSEFIDNRIKSLSTGQTQRVSIARCLFADPGLYILDEPTLGLDIMSAAAIVDFMEEEKAAGKTIIYSTHYLEEAERLCDKVVLINRGRVIAEDSPAGLCAATGRDTLRTAFLKCIEDDEMKDRE
jgi:sodium transport system ATP-binding protein